MNVPLDAWLHLVQDEYLREYLPGGGSAVKFLVGQAPETLGEVDRRLARLALEEGFEFARVDSARIKIHMIDQLFHEVARQLRWVDLARNYVVELLTADGFRIPAEADRFSFEGIAAVNNFGQAQLRGRLRDLLWKQVFRDPAMAQEFALAMMHLCQALLEDPADGTEVMGTISAWLQGELRLVSALKRYQIYQKIGRHNARHMFLSMAHWLRRTGAKGLVLVLDIGAYTASSRPLEAGGGLYHTPAAAMDAYEVLRQFIDETDQLESCFAAVLAPQAFLTDEKRGLSKYDALRLRVWDEVHDRQRENPLSSLVRIEGLASALEGAA
ncbi:MAG TPA: BREX system ATP-binding domain-containing protein [Chloroflexota bacterium]|nr:BREX system ATP-binding domain-containing protein [Chloroflexota bacterium]